MTTNVLARYVSHRLKTLQERHNFDPNAGAGYILNVIKISGSKEAHEISNGYGSFRELLDLAQKFSLDVDIPFNASGGPGEKAAKRRKHPKKIYVFQVVGTNVYKFGRSINPWQRLKKVATDNANVVRLRHEVVVENAVRVEGNLKKRFRKFKTRDRDQNYKGEWFEFDHGMVRDIVSQLKAGETFDRFKTPMPNRS